MEQKPAQPSVVKDRPPYLDPSLPIPERVKDLLGRMTLAEKIAQMNHPTRGVPRLGIPPYNYWNEALHGVARNGRATVFPQAIAMAATWDPALVQRIASAIGDEARAKHHATIRRFGQSGIYQGLTFWSPNVNIFRDPRWGRGQETWGEDPFLTGEMGAAFVRGLQGDHPKYMKAAACAKHYAVHSGPEKDRHTFNAVVSRRDLYATYLPAFKKLVVDARVEAVMGAYNRTLGEPCCASQLLLVDILRGEWGFAGHVVSDCGALSDIHRNHHYTKDAVETAALAIKRGCDLGCDHVYDELGEAVQRGLVGEAEIDVCLGRTLATRFRLGMFDPPEQVPFTSIPMSVVGCDAHRELAYQAALKSVVLLKNKNGLLPLGEKVRSILVVGPNATSTDILLGNYHGLNEHMTTLLEGLIGRVPEGVKLEYRLGCQLAHPNKNSHDWSVFEAANSDVTIACMGISPMMEGEEGDAILSDSNGDRVNIGLPAVQVSYLKELASRGAKIVLLLAGGSPITLGEIEDMVQAIVYVWYPGQEGGRAVADLLFGSAAPSGKLPLTFPRSVDQLPPFEDYTMTPQPEKGRDGRTYRYSRREPLYPFGFGLSYTTFQYSGLKLGKETLAAGDALPVSLTLANAGPVEAEEVVQFYLSDLEASVPVPQHSLVGFQRLRLAPGEKQAVEFTLTPQMMVLFDEDGKQKLEPGRFRLTVGGCSPGMRGLALGAAQPVQAEFEVI